MDVITNDRNNDHQVFIRRNAKYLRRCLQVLPSSHSSLDISRLTIAFFAISGLDLLNSLDVIEDDRQSIIDWIYSLQILTTNSKHIGTGRHGFRGSPTNGRDHPYDCGNVAMTYCALSSLVILGDDLKRVDKEAIINGLKDHRLSDGSFVPVVFEKENDMRFVYCCATISYILNDWSAIDRQKTVSFIMNSFTYDCGFGQCPGLESHGGSTYCALASLSLMDELSQLSAKQLSSLTRWCLFRQANGFQGRPNKDPDTCYSFWVGAALKLIDAYHLINIKQNENFILDTQDLVTGGLAKYPDNTPDPMHTYLGLSGMALNPTNNYLLSVYAALNISDRAVQHLNKLHSDWKNS
ncbi:geranylgeranyl transferase type-1 subunit beta-like [Oppia nitens]|uniref:geranylgeranyl transferase type-1 subunit beta-like n=1 Tax=Oppia nitens TaxID=1686743 RepID=UPI0023DC9648|nr:geranylgeranyl transferase type-1 subunit beta-like [Oppia nitens]